MKTKLNKFATAMVFLFLGTTSMAQADVLDDQTVRTTFTTILPHGGPVIEGHRTSVVGPGTEIANANFPATSGYVDIDFSDTNILITNNTGVFGPGPTVGLRFEDAFGTIPRFTGVTINPATTWPGYNGSIGFGPDSIGGFYLFGGFSGAQLSLDITAVVPEPATASLLLLSVLLIASNRRRICADRRYPIV